MGKSRARFEYDVLAEMRRRGISAVRPIAFGERRSGGFLKACFLMTEGVTGAPSLDVLSDDPLIASVDQVLKYKPETIAAMSGSSETFPVEVGPVGGAPPRIYIKRYR